MKKLIALAFFSLFIVTSVMADEIMPVVEVREATAWDKILYGLGLKGIATPNVVDYGDTLRAEFYLTPNDYCSWGSSKRSIYFKWSWDQGEDLDIKNLDCVHSHIVTLSLYIRNNYSPGSHKIKAWLEDPLIGKVSGYDYVTFKIGSDVPTVTTQPAPSCTCYGPCEQNYELQCHPVNGQCCLKDTTSECEFGDLKCLGNERWVCNHDGWEMADDCWSDYQMLCREIENGVQCHDPDDPDALICERDGTCPTDCVGDGEYISLLSCDQFTLPVPGNKVTCKECCSGFATVDSMQFLVCGDEPTITPRPDADHCVLPFFFVRNYNLLGPDKEVDFVYPGDKICYGGSVKQCRLTDGDYKMVEIEDCATECLNEKNVVEWQCAEDEECSLKDGVLDWIMCLMGIDPAIAVVVLILLVVFLLAIIF